MHVLHLDHECDATGCTNVLILDGNLKNRRAVCSATHAGYIEYSGLPGRVRSGCQNTPSQDSPYCEFHKPILAKPQKFDVSGVESSTNSVLTEEEPVGIIINKRETRNSVLYEVYLDLEQKINHNIYSLHKYMHVNSKKLTLLSN